MSQRLTGDLKDSLVVTVRRWGLERRAEPFQLSSGSWTHDYVDAKRALASGARLREVAEAVLAVADEEGVTFEAVGGLTMGADPIAVAVAVAARDKSWFSVRKEPKRHGQQRRVEGAELVRGTSVLAVDDVVTTGRSLLDALGVLEALGARVVLAIALVDRGETTARLFSARDVPYRPLLTYGDLGIDPVPGSWPDAVDPPAQ